MPDPQSIFAGIRKLPPAHFLLLARDPLARDGGPAAPQRYWRPEATACPAQEDEAEAELIERLRAAVRRAAGRRRAARRLPVRRRRLRAPWWRSPPGCAPTPLDTFTIGFEGGEDETPYAALVARRYGTRQHNERAAAIDMIEAARAAGADFRRAVRRHLGGADATASAALARRHATVALSGDGGDEVFAGYRRYRWHVLVEQAARRCCPRRCAGRLIGGLARLYPKLDRAPRWLRAKHTLTELSLDSRARLSPHGDPGAATSSAARCSRRRCGPRWTATTRPRASPR